MANRIRKIGITHKEIPIPATKGKDGSSLVVELTRQQLKAQGLNVTSKEIWEVYSWSFKFIAMVIEDGTAERISVPYFGNFSPKKGIIRDEIWEALPDYAKESMKKTKLKGSELIAIFADPVQSGEYARRIAKLPRYRRVSDFTFSPNNLPADGLDTRITGVRPEQLVSAPEQTMAPDDPGVQGPDSQGQGIGGGLQGLAEEMGH